MRTPLPRAANRLSRTRASSVRLFVNQSSLARAAQHGSARSALHAEWTLLQYRPQNWPNKLTSLLRADKGLTGPQADARCQMVSVKLQPVPTKQMMLGVACRRWYLRSWGHETSLRPPWDMAKLRCSCPRSYIHVLHEQTPPRTAGPACRHLPGSYAARVQPAQIGQSTIGCLLCTAARGNKGNKWPHP